MQHKGLIISIVAVVIILAAVVGLSVGNNNKSDNSASNASTNSDMNMKMHTDTSASQSSQQSNTSNAVEGTAVTISNFAFSPASIKIKVGQTVTWTNNDSVGHTVTADNLSSDAPDSKLLNKGDTYSFTFTKAGTYTYHCTPHTYMKGSVVVSE